MSTFSTGSVTSSIFPVVGSTVHFFEYNQILFFLSFHCQGVKNLEQSVFLKVKMARLIIQRTMEHHTTRFMNLIQTSAVKIILTIMSKV